MDEPKMYKCKLGEACTCKHQPHQYKMPCPNYEQVTLTNTPRPGETPAQIAARLRLPFGRCEACGEEHQHPFIAAAAELDALLFDPPEKERQYGSRLPAAEAMRSAAELFEERASAYGNNYWTASSIMKILFPKGARLETESEFMRYQFLEHIVNKLTRYAANFDSGGHEDSSMDSGVYWFMLHAADRIFGK